MDKKIREEIEKIKEQLEEIHSAEDEKCDNMQEYFPNASRTERQEEIVNALLEAIGSLDDIIDC